jgi:biopolymer transport protein ExbD
MRTHRMPAIKEGGVNVTPLIDIVMCLIIFFMLVAKIGVDTGADSKIDIPESIKGLDIKDMGNTLTLNVQQGAMEQPIVTALVPDPNNKGVNARQELKIVDPATNKRPLLDTLKYFRFGDKKTNRPENPEFSVIIRAGENLDYRYIEPVLQSCAEARVKSYNFNTKKKVEAVQ